MDINKIMEPALQQLALLLVSAGSIVIMALAKKFAKKISYDIEISKMSIVEKVATEAVAEAEQYYKSGKLEASQRYGFAATRIKERLVEKKINILDEKVSQKIEAALGKCKINK